MQDKALRRRGCTILIASVYTGIGEMFAAMKRRVLIDYGETTAIAIRIAWNSNGVPPSRCLFIIGR
jgi:hypothetical protein